MNNNIISMVNKQFFFRNDHILKVWCFIQIYDNIIKFIKEKFIILSSMFFKQIKKHYWWCCL